MKNNLYFGITILLLAFVASIPSAVAQTSKVGIYITVKYKRKCENPATSLDEKKYCLAPQPVLTIDDISHVTPINLDLANQRYFNLVFKESGVAKLKNLSIAFPNATIVLVADNLILGFLKDLDVLRFNTLKMTADPRSEKNVDFVHDKLKAFLPEHR